MRDHRYNGMDTSDWFILQVCNSDSEARDVQRAYHEQGYDGRSSSKFTSNSPRNKMAKGVSQYKGKYKVRIKVDSSFVLLGCYTDVGVANRMYKKANDNKHLYNGSTKQFRATLRQLRAK